MRTAGRVALALALLLTAPAQAGTTQAKPGPPAASAPSANERAIAAGEEGLRAYDRADWAGALAAFEAADGLFHSPVFTLYQARALRNLGRLREAKARFEALAGETLAADAPPPWIDAKASAQGELATLNAELPRVAIDARGASRAAVARIDGAPAALGTPFPVDPGEHEIEVRDGALTRSVRVTTRRGEPTLTVRVELAPAAAPEAAPQGWLIAGATLAGVGGAALIAGGVFGGVALGQADAAATALPRTCDAARRCLPGDEAAVDAAYGGAYSWASASDGLLFGGGALAATGIVILLVDRLAGDRADVKASARGLELLF